MMKTEHFGVNKISLNAFYTLGEKGKYLTLESYRYNFTYLKIWHVDHLVETICVFSEINIIEFLFY